MLSNVTITDMQGRQLISKDLKGEIKKYTLPVNDLNEGLYLLRITTEDNTVHTQQVIKK